MEEIPGPDRDFTEVMNGGGSADEPLAHLVESTYPSLREIARQVMARENRGHTLSPTALIHEAFVRLVDQQRVTAGGTKFFKLCFARECRRALVDHARAKKAQRRGGGAVRETLVARTVASPAGTDLLELHEAIEALAQLNERMARIVDMRVFAGMTVEECAATLEVSRRTVDSDWAFARSWLEKQLR